MTFATVFVAVEKIKTSPECDCIVDVEEPEADGAAGDGTVEGYARYELSEDGESAQMALLL
jgi:hypothetical protein